MLENLLSSAVTGIIAVLATLVGSYFSYKTALTTLEKTFKNEFDKLKYENARLDHLSTISWKQDIYLEFLSKAPTSYYMKSENTYIEYLSIYRRFSIVCPKSAESCFNEIHKMIVDASLTHHTINDDFESLLSSLAMLLKEELRKSK